MAPCCGVATPTPSPRPPDAVTVVADVTVAVLEQAALLGLNADRRKLLLVMPNRPLSQVSWRTRVAHQSTEDTAGRRLVGLQLMRYTSVVFDARYTSVVFDA
jgi:hypothetical protein